MANPAIGGHTISAYIGSNATFTSSAITTQATGSSLIAFIGCGGSDVFTVSDTYNASGAWTKIALGSGANPIQDTNDGEYLSVYVCVNAAGGSGDQLTVAGASNNLREVNFIEVTSSILVDVSASAYNGNSGSTVSVPVTPSIASALVLAAALTGTGSFTLAPQAGGSWTALDATAGVVSQGSGYLVAAATSAQDAMMGRASGTTALAGITLVFEPVVSSGVSVAWLT